MTPAIDHDTSVGAMHTHRTRKLACLSTFAVLQNAIARAEYQLAYQIFLSRPRPGNARDANCVEHLAEQKARDHCLDVCDRMALLEAGSWLDAPAG